jgi:hypothetical protein
LQLVEFSSKPEFNLIQEVLKLEEEKRKLDEFFTNPLISWQYCSLSKDTYWNAEVKNWQLSYDFLVKASIYLNYRKYLKYIDIYTFKPPVKVNRTYTKTLLAIPFDYDYQKLIKDFDSDKVWLNPLLDPSVEAEPNWRFFSMNPNVDLSNPNIMTFFYAHNPNFKVSDFLDHPELDWSVEKIYDLYPTKEVIETILKGSKKRIDDFCSFGKIKMEHIKIYQDVLNWHLILSNENINETILEEYPERFSNWVTRYIKVSFVFKHLDWDWNWEGVSNMATIEEMMSRPNLPWRFRDIEEKIPWTTEPKYYPLFGNRLVSDFRFCKSAPIEIFFKDLGKNWCWLAVSLNPGLTADIINNYPQVDWDYRSILRNKNVNISEIDPKRNLKAWVGVNHITKDKRMNEYWEIPVSYNVDLW